MSDEREAVKPPVREADQWRGPGGTGRFPQLGPRALEREQRRLDRVRLIALPPRDEYDDEDPGPAAA